MMTTKAKKAPTTQSNEQATDMARESDEMQAKYAQMALSPELAAFRAIDAVEGTNIRGLALDAASLLDCLRDQAEAVNRGDMTHIESMLMNQATALQSLFAKMIENGIGQPMLPLYDAQLRIALRAQAQCRQTLETLATIKNPPIVYTKQANVTTGPQQVNNGVPAPACAQEIENAPNKQLEAEHEPWLDTRAPGTTISADSTMEAVGEIHRTKNRRR